MIPAKKMREYRASKGIPEPQGGQGGRAGRGGGGYGAEAEWLAAFKGGPPASNFLNTANCSEAIALAGAAMRYSGKIFKAGTCAPLLLEDKENMKFTYVHDAHQS
jgi:hypothetical protein